MWELESEIEYGGTGRGEGGPWYAMLGGWTEERKNALVRDKFWYEVTKSQSS